METLNIGFISDKSAPVYFGGYEIRVLELANRLAKKGHDVHVFTSCPNDFVTPEGAAFHASFPQAFLNGVSGKRSIMHSTIFSMLLARNPMGKWNPDFLIVESIPYLHLLFMRRWMSQLHAVNILDVPEAWNNYNYLRNGFGASLGGASSTMIRRLLQIGISFSDVVIAISNTTAKSLAENYHVDGSKLSVVPCGVDLESLQNIAGNYRKNTSAGKFYDFVTVGRLVEIKRHADFIDALGIMKREYGWNGKAAIIGSGPLRDELESRVQRNEIVPNVDFKGFVSDEEKVRLLAASKAFVLASEREGFSIATLEAMAVGLPVIVAKPAEAEVFGPSEFVVDGKNGLFYPVGDRVGLAESMTSLLESNSNMSRFGINSQTTASSYDWQGVVNTLEWELKNSRREESRIRR